MVAVRNSANDGKIAVGGLYLVFQQEVRLLIEKSILGQYNFLNLTVEVFPGLKKLQIFRDAAVTEYCSTAWENGCPCTA